MEDGTLIPAGTAAAAVHLRESLGLANSQEEAAAFIAEAEAIHRLNTVQGHGSVQTFRGDAVRARHDAATGSVTVQSVHRTTGRIRTLSWDTTALGNLQRQMSAAGLSEAEVRGANFTVRDDAGRLVRHYEAHGGADITTILHERFETSYKSGRIALADIQSAAAHLAALPQFDPAQSSDPGVIKLGQTLQRIAQSDSTLSETERRETLMELAVADVLGRFRDGTEITPGSIQSAVRSAALSAPGPQRGALHSVRRMLAVVRRYLGGMFETARQFREARESGELTGDNAWDSFVRKLEERHAGESTGVESSLTYSVKPVPWLENIEAALANRLSPNSILEIGKPGEILTASGVPDLPTLVRLSKVRTTRNKHSELELEILRGLPAALNDPMLVYISPGDGKAHTIVTSIATRSGPLTAYFNLCTGQGQTALEAKTIFGKEPEQVFAEVRKAAAAGLITYKNKAAFDSWLSAQGDGGPKGDTSTQHNNAIEGLSEFFSTNSQESNGVATRGGMPAEHSVVQKQAAESAPGTAETYGVAADSAPERQARMSITAAARRAKLDPGQADVWTESEVETVINNIRHQNPGTHHDALDNVSPHTGPFSRAQVLDWVNDFLTFIPPEFLPSRANPLAAGILKKFNITFAQTPSDGRIMGQWHSATGEAVLFVNAQSMNDPAVAKRVLFHELGHWLQECATPEGKIWVLPVLAWD